LLEALLPDRTPRRGGRWMDHRSFLDGALWRTRVGAPWRDVPPEYGNWKTIYNRHRAWWGSGMWAQILAQLQAGADAQAVDEQGRWAVSVDSTIARAHQHAAGARHAPAADLAEEPADEPAEEPAGGLAGLVTGGCTE
jgi:transposase